MKYLVLSDLHANAEALDAVLEQVADERFDATLLLGDLVGYGAAPSRVLAELDRLPAPVWSVRGNHDKAVAGLTDGADFNVVARTAVDWTARRLGADQLARIRELPAGPVTVEEDLVICHGSPADEDVYLLTTSEAGGAFAATDARVVFFGHTHLASLFALEDGRVFGGLLRGPEGELELLDGVRYLFNPGSVGQPRDGDPQAAYMTYDSARGRLRWFRVAYPIERAQERIRAAGLPGVLADRLASGM